MTRTLFQLSDDNIAFPPIEYALDDPQGLLAIGGDLSVERLLNAYQSGIFPWFSMDEPILWWAPSPRMVLQPHEIHISRSMQKVRKQNKFRVSFDTAFERVIQSCATRPPIVDKISLISEDERDSRLDLAMPESTNNNTDSSTWITPEMQTAYINLFHAGYAHSVEVWDQGMLVGGLYGVCIGRMFFGESMFSLLPNTSKLALIALAQRLSEQKFTLIDCQLPTDHLKRLGAYLMPMTQFSQYLENNQTLGLTTFW